jgi:hypothetical protein
VTDRKSTSSFIREPNTGDVWAKVDNSSYPGIAYSSFDHNPSLASTFTNWSYNTTKITGTGFLNGTKAYNLNGAGQVTPIFPLVSTQKYRLSLWRKIGSGSNLTLTSGSTTLTPRLGAQHNGWQYVEVIFTNATSVQVAGNYMIDELRLCPVSARMKSYVFKDGVGVVTECNENNQQLFYEYDEFNRLKLTRDLDNNILKKNEYKFQHIQN